MKITSAKTETFTADRARKEFPAMDANARPLKERYVDQYLRDMNGGFWYSNPMAPICIVTLPNGTEILANGNHRVEAIRRSSARVDAFVIRANMTEEEYSNCLASTDIGAGRSYSDTKPLIGIANTQTVLYCLRLEDVQDGPVEEYGKRKYSPFVMKAFESANEELVSSAIQLVKKVKPLLGGAKVSWASLGATFYHALNNNWTAPDLIEFSGELGKAWVEMAQRGSAYASIGQRGSSRAPALKQQYILDCMVAFWDNDDLPVDIDTDLREDGLFLGRIVID